VDFLSYNIAIVLAPILYVLIHFKNLRIHHHARWVISGSLVLSLLVMLVDIPVLTNLIQSGHVSLSLFLLIMFAGVFKRTSVFYKRLLLVRGDLAIIAFIFLIPHGIGRLDLALTGYNITGLFAMIIMLPLTLSSFMVIRKRIRPDRWKKLHKLAYVAYLMIYIHLGFTLFLNPVNVYMDFSRDSILYHGLFLIYISLKIVRMIEKKQATSNKTSP
jgi:DMSO/TMAO reductase YedYZ heme-binding membrane subunit